MPASVPLRAAAESLHPLLGHAAATSPAAYVDGRPVSAARFLAHARLVAATLPDRGHLLNACRSRYQFAVVLAAALLRGQLTLMPPTMTPNVVAALRAFAPDAYFVGDPPEGGIDLPVHALPALPERDDGSYDVPHLPGSQRAACVFTSGSTGEPRPHFKDWGSLARNIAAEARRLGVGAGHSILGTVPPQHMYGFESTVLLPLLAGAAMAGERLYFPADIDAAIEAAAAPRLLFTTPFHLRAWCGAGAPARIEAIVSATAPLSVALAREVEALTGARLHEIYGCTEAGQVATRRPTSGPEWQPLDDLRVWTEGEQAFAVGGHVPEPTALMDVIEVRPDGRFLLHGRQADLVNIAGKRNSIGYLNHQLTAIPGVRDGTFFLPDADEVEAATRLMAFVVAPGLSKAQVLEGLRARLDPAFLPRPLVLVESLPRQLTGKLPREALRALAAASRRRGDA